MHRAIKLELINLLPPKLKFPIILLNTKHYATVFLKLSLLLTYFLKQ